MTQRQRTSVHDAPWADYISKMEPAGEPTLTQLRPAVGRGPWAAASLELTLQVKPLEVRGSISYGHKRLPENPMHRVALWQQALGPGSWSITSSACRSWQSTGEFPESAPAPCKQLSRQKNSTNSIAEVRWLNILAAFFWVYGISTQSSVLHGEHNTHQKSSHS